MAALYLKYRPQSLDQLIGQEGIKKILLAAFQSGRLSHAYLFVGPRGTGKTSTARILAKMVNCELSVIPAKAGIQVPCNECTTCISITDGSNLDLIEIDAASNRGIDDIRSLRENLKLSPSGAKKKVYIIDEVHMLTTEAFNALLKTLEEPPLHALFILATTEAQKVPQTILSRVQRLDFKLATPLELETALQKIIDTEKIDIEKEALKILIKRAEGSFRDGIKLLDQVSSGGKKIGVEDLKQDLQIADFDVLVRLVENLSQKNTQNSLLTVSKMHGDIKSQVLSMMDISRSLMLIKNDLGELLVRPEYGDEKYEALKLLSEKFLMPDLVKLIECLQAAAEKIKFASIPMLPLELAVLEICTPSTVILSEVSPKADESKDLSRMRDSNELRDSSQPKADQNDNNNNKGSDDVVGPDVSLLQEKWNFVLETIKPFNFSLEALLRLVKILDCKDGMVLLEVPYSFHQRILEAPKSRDLLESVLSDVLSKPIRVTCILGNKPLTAEDVANVEVAADDEVIKAAAEIFGTEPSN